jgi:hypothetical protein
LKKGFFIGSLLPLTHFYWLITKASKQVREFHSRLEQTFKLLSFPNLFGNENKASNTGTYHQKRSIEVAKIKFISDFSGHQLPH